MSLQTNAFRFLDLPPEIRLMVYEHLPLSIRQRDIKLEHPERNSGERLLLITRGLPVGILATSKTIHVESASIVRAMVQDLILSSVPKVISTETSEPFIGLASFREAILETVYIFRNWLKTKAIGALTKQELLNKYPLSLPYTESRANITLIQRLIHRRKVQRKITSHICRYPLEADACWTTSLDHIFRFVQQAICQLSYQSNMGQEQLVEIFTTPPSWSWECLAHTHHFDRPYHLHERSFDFRRHFWPSVVWNVIYWQRCPASASTDSTISEPAKDDTVEQLIFDNDTVEQLIFDLTHHPRQMRSCVEHLMRIRGPRGNVRPLRTEDWLGTKE